MMFTGVFQTADDVRRAGAAAGMLPENIEAWIVTWEASKQAEYKKTRYCLNCDCAMHANEYDMCWQCGQGNLTTKMPAYWTPCYGPQVRAGDALSFLDGICEQLGLVAPIVVVTDDDILAVSEVQLLQESTDRT